MINHIGKDFVNSVHSYNRVLNDIFEDDEVNKKRVYEASIDVSVDKNYDTFLILQLDLSKLKIIYKYL